MESYFSITVTSEDSGCELASFLKAHGFSKKAISRLKNSTQSFEVSGCRVNSNYILCTGDKLRVPIFNQRPPKAHIIAQNAPLARVYEDEYLIVVDKPRRLPMYPHRAGESGSLANIMAYHYPAQTFHAFNRLDENTAGLVLLAKNAHVLHLLQQTSVDKYYLLYAEGHLPASGIIDLPLYHQNGQPRVLVDYQSGKEARTAYTTLAYFTDYSLVRVHLLTGRTHQIRAHMAAIGHPLVGDTLYGAKKAHQSYRLLAYLLEIVHPISGEKLTCESPQALCF